MSKNARDLGPNMTDSSPRKASMVARATGKIGGSLIDTLLSSFWNYVLVAPAFGYLALWFADVVPGPVELVNKIGGEGASQPTPPRSSGIAEVKALGDGGAGTIGRAVQVAVTGQLRPMPEQFGGIRVHYALGPITSGRGATSATTVRWALAAQGTEWLYCTEVPLTFTSQRALAEQIASQINNSLLASETVEKLQCG